jgi:hypothetical protein
MSNAKTEGSTEPDYTVWYTAAAVAAIVLLAPIAVLIAGGWLLAERVFGLRAKPAFLTAGVGAVLTGVFALIGWVSVDGYFAAYESLWAAVRSDGSWGIVIQGVLAGQWLVGITVGSAAAGGWMMWKNRKSATTEVVVDRAPIGREKRHKVKTETDIATGVGAPNNGTTLGVSCDMKNVDSEFGVIRYGDRVIISDTEMSGHVLVVGGSGSGKTQSMLSNIRDAIRLGRGVVVVDCKGGPDVPEVLAEWANRYGREFLHWSITDPNRGYGGPADGPAFYDPISRGDASRRKDLLIGAHRWDVEYYRSVIANYLQTVFRIIDLVPAIPGMDTFSDVADLLSPGVLLRRAKNISVADHPQLAADLTRMSDMDRQELSGIRSMYARLQTLIGSTAGAWLRKDPQGLRDIDLRRTAYEGQVVVFSLDTSNYEETATLLAGLIVQDLKTLSSELRYSPAGAPMHVYVDEFSAVDSTNILGLLSKARDARMPVMLATQALADLQRTEPTFVDQVLGIVSSFIVHRANTAEDARTFAGLSGMRYTEASEGGLLSRQEEYTISVGRFQKLERGQCIFIAKNPVSKVIDYVQVIMENPNVDPHKREGGVVREILPYRPEKEASTRKTYAHPDAPRVSELPIVEDIVVSEPVTSVVSPSSGPVRPHMVKASDSVSKSVSSNTSGSAVKAKPAGSPIPGVDTTP